MLSDKSRALPFGQGDQGQPSVPRTPEQRIVHYTKHWIDVPADQEALGYHAWRHRIDNLVAPVASPNEKADQEAAFRRMYRDSDTGRTELELERSNSDILKEVKNKYWGRSDGTVEFHLRNIINYKNNVGDHNTANAAMNSLRTIKELVFDERYINSENKYIKMLRTESQRIEVPKEK